MSLLINIARGVLSDLTGEELRLYLSLRYTEETIRHEREVLYGGAALKSSHDIVSRLPLSEARKHLRGSTDASVKKAEQGLLAKGVTILIEVEGDGPTERIYLLGYIIGIHRQYLIDQDAIERDWPLDTTPVLVKKSHYQWGERINEAIPLEVISQAIKRQKARQFKGVTFKLGVPEEKGKVRPILKKKDKVAHEKRQHAYRDWQLHQGAYVYTEEGDSFTVLPYYDMYYEDCPSVAEWQQKLDAELARMRKLREKK